MITLQLYLPLTATVEGSRERVLDAYRDVRDVLLECIKNMLDNQPMGNLRTAAAFHGNRE